MTLDCGFRRNDGVPQTVDSCTNEHLSQSVYGPPAAQGDVDSRVRGNGGRGLVTLPDRSNANTA